MSHRTSHIKSRVLLYGGLCLGIVFILIGGAILAGCQPIAEATLPTPTSTVSSPSTPVTSPTDDASAAEAKEIPTEQKPFQLTILHTNDTYGEVDPGG